MIRINGSPIHLVQPEILRFKVYEAVLVAGEDSFANIDVRVRVKGGGHTSQVYAIRQAIAKAVVAYFAKYVDAFSAIELKKKLVAYDRTLLIADPRRMEPKKFGGGGARARRQKRCVMLRLPRFFATEPDCHSVIGDGCLLLYVCVVKCRIFFHYQYVMTSCNNYAAMQLSVLPSQCLMSMSESPIIQKCIIGETTTRFSSQFVSTAQYFSVCMAFLHIRLRW